MEIFKRKGRFSKCFLGIAAVLFFGSMLFLTLEARTIHNRMLPNIKMKRLEEKTGRLFLPKEMYDAGDVYIVEEAEKNGETRNFVKKADLTIGESVEGGYLILDGISEWDFVVIKTDKELLDGMEVFLPE